MANRSATREPRRKRPTASQRRVRRRLGLAAASALAIAVLYGSFLAWSVTRQFEGRRWDLPAQVYAAPLELYAGRALDVEDLAAELDRLGFAQDPRLTT